MSVTETGSRLQRVALGFVAVLLIAFIVVGLLRWHSSHQLAQETTASTSAPSTVDVVMVHAGGLSGSLALPGETAAWYQSTIYARVSGYVARWYVDIGDEVKAGQTLATIDTPELDAELLAARAKLQVALAQVRIKQADAQFAATTDERWRDSPKGVVSEQEREDKRAADVAAVAGLEAARAQVNLDQADVDRLSAYEAFKKVTAPYAGNIVERHIDIGNLVAAGSSSGNTPLYRMQQADPIRVFVDVPQSAAPDLMKTGVVARISTRGGGDIDGTITRTSAAVDPRSRTFRVELDLSNADHRLVPGMYIQAQFHLQNQGMIQIPAAALIFTAAGPRVAVVDQAGKIRYRDVVIGRDDGEQVELASGVSDGEQLVLNISNQILEGEKVRVSNSGVKS